MDSSLTSPVCTRARSQHTHRAHGHTFTWVHGHTLSKFNTITYVFHASPGVGHATVNVNYGGKVLKELEGDRDEKVDTDPSTLKCMFKDNLTQFKVEPNAQSREAQISIQVGSAEEMTCTIPLDAHPNANVRESRPSAKNTAHSPDV